MRWDAARAASKRITPTKRKPIGPVGEKLDTKFCFTDKVERRHISGEDFDTCTGCGYVVCSCERQDWVNCYPHGERWDRLGPTPGCRQCKDEELQKAVDRLAKIGEELQKAVDRLAKIGEQKRRGVPYDLRPSAGEFSGLRSILENSDRLFGVNNELSKPIDAMWKPFPIDPAMSHGRGCATALCGNPAPASMFCSDCLRKADAEAKPFRDAMDEKIKTLMQSYRRFNDYVKLAQQNRVYVGFDPGFEEPTSRDPYFFLETGIYDRKGQKL